MRLLALLTASIVVLGASLTTERAAEPFVPFAVSYDVDASRDRTHIRRDLETIRSLGFNSVRVVSSWRIAEEVRRRYRFEALDELLTLADEADLKAIVEIDVSAPDWIGRVYPDAQLVVDRQDNDPSATSGVPRSSIGSRCRRSVYHNRNRARGFTCIRPCCGRRAESAQACARVDTVSAVSRRGSPQVAPAARAPVWPIDMATYAALTRRDG
jgi:hypothetical protein